MSRVLRRPADADDLGQRLEQRRAENETELRAEFRKRHGRAPREDDDLEEFQAMLWDEQQVEERAEQIVREHDARQRAEEIRRERERERAGTSTEVANPVADLAAILDGLDEQGDQEPMICLRSDGAGLFYEGHSNSIVGLSGSAKSWVFLYSTLERIAAGERVTIWDFEEPRPDRSLSRIQAMVAARDDVTMEDVIKLLNYVCVRQSISGGDIRAALQPSLVCLDGYGKALRLHGLKNDEEGVLALDIRLIVPLTDEGVTTISADHLPKARDNQDGPIGSVQKLNQVSGAALIIRQETPMGLGRKGTSRIYLTDKDRGGQLSAKAVEDSDGDGRLCVAVLTVDAEWRQTSVTVDVPEGVAAQQEARLSQRAEQASKILEALPGEELSKTALAREMGGNKQEALTAIDLLIRQGGYVAVREGTGRGGSTRLDGKRTPPQFLTSLKPYRVPSPVRQSSIDRGF